MKILPRSILYSIAPIATNTPYIESLTSYIARLSEAHHVTVGSLITYLVRPKLQTSYLDTPCNSELLKISSRAMNGTLSWAENVANIMGDLTGTDNLQSLTMLTWQNVLPVKGLLKKYRSWCPYCYTDWKSGRHILYEPLIWTLESVNICQTHEQYLIDRCPHCKSQMSWLSRYTRPGYCSSCGKWLGAASIDTTPILDETCEFEKWVAGEVGKILIENQNTDNKPITEYISEGLSQIVDQVCNGNCSEFARMVKVYRRTVSDWCRGDQKPKLRKIIEISYCTGISSVNFLTGKLPRYLDIVIQELPSVNNQSDTFKIKKDWKSRYTYLHDNVKKVALDSRQTPVSVKELARQLNHDPSHLKKLFPDLCSIISKRYRSFQTRKKLTNNSRLRMRIKTAVQKTVKKGKRPSIYQICRELEKPGIMRNDVARKIHQEILKELDN